MEEKKYEVVLKIFVLQIAAIVMILPFVWLISTAVKSPAEVFTGNINLIPETFRWSNFAEIMDQAPFWLYMGNTIIVCVGI
jgi:ABC-type glycerol-3-phosphate transport system permease component